VEPVALAARFALATVFLLAGAAKLSALPQFTAGVAKFELLPQRLVRPVAYSLPPLELVGGLALALGIGMRVVAGLLALVLAGFTIAVSAALAERKRIDCGCFGPGAPRPITWLTVLRNLVLLGPAVLVAAKAPRALSLDAALFGGRHASAATGTAMLVVGTLAVFAALATSEAVRYRRLRDTIREEAA
jgi:uncharacterized membrane protein YphA (DoxX/SURF4 family)